MVEQGAKRAVSRDHTAPRVAVVGAGPAGLSAAVSAAERGFDVTVFEKGTEIGGQFRYAMAVPGKEDFEETLRYYGRRMEVLGVSVRLGVEATVADLDGFDEVVIATGVTPRVPTIKGVEHAVTYAEVLGGEVVPGKRVAVIGAGGIGVDVSHWLTHDPEETFDDWMSYWGVGDPSLAGGGLVEKKARPQVREVTLVQRKTSMIGKGLGKTSGWAHRAVLKQAGVQQIAGATYDEITPDALIYTVGGTQHRLEVDTVILCAGQESVRGLYDELAAAGRAVHLIGGADVAAELDAKRAIEQGTRLAAAF